MSDYEYTYTDMDEDILNIRSYGRGVRFFSTNEAIDIEREDAPALALAILEAAGIEYVTTAEAANPSVYIGPERLAATSLQEWSRLRSKRAEREAEDAKVIAFRDTSLAAIYGDGDPNHDAWNALTNTGREGWRTRYRAARKFFEES